jgi:hypothetical protein
MRKILFSLVFFLTIQQTFAAALAMRPAAMESAGAKPPHSKHWAVYNERRGVGHTIAKVGGALAGICLGPLGYFGVRLCTSDQDIRDCAGRGFKLWGFFACIAVVCGIAYLTKSSPGSMDFLDQWFAN